MAGYRFKFDKGEVVPIEDLRNYLEALFSPYLKGVFETILVLRKKPVLLERHLIRLYASASFFSIPLPEREKVRELVEKKASSLDAEKGALRLVVQLNELYRETCIMVSEREYPYTDEMYLKGFKVCFSKWRRDFQNPLYKHKVLHQLENRVAREIAVRSGYDDCLFLNLKGNVSEATASNIFIVKDGVLRTAPETEGLLKGVVRDALIDLCLSDEEIAVEESPVSADEFVAAEEAFLTNSLMGIMPIVSVEQRKIGNGVPGPITGNLSAKIWDYFERV